MRRRSRRRRRSAQDCAVRAHCLEEALARIPDGIAGGLTPEERRNHHLRRPPVRELEVPAGAGTGEVQVAGLRLLAAGRPTREVARRCGVTERTVARWAARTTTPSTTATGPALGNIGIQAGPS